jgi:hypothetical protein
MWGCWNPGGRIGFARQSRADIQHLKNFRTCHLVKDIPAIPAILDYPCFSEDSQVLGNIGLSVPQQRFHVAYTGFTFSQDLQYRQPGWMHQRFEDDRLLFVSVHLNAIPDGIFGLPNMIIGCILSLSLCCMSHQGLTNVLTADFLHSNFTVCLP